MSKLLVQTLVILGFGAAAYVSVSTNLKLNQVASSDLITSIDRSRQLQAELYKESSDESTRRILSLLDRTQENIKTAVDQNLMLTSQVLGLAKSVDDVSKQNKELSEEMAQVLGEHTKTLEQAKAKASQAAQAAKTDQISTQKAIKAIQQPKKSWWGGLFASPTPIPRR